MLLLGATRGNSMETPGKVGEKVVPEIAGDRKSMLQHLIDFHSTFILKPLGLPLAAKPTFQRLGLTLNCQQWLKK